MTKTSIEWTDCTWNCVRGCARVSKGCEHCYAEGVARRFAGPGQPYEGLVRLDAKGKPKAQWNGEVRFVPEKLAEPLSWRKPRRVFVNSMSDLFHEGLAFEQIAAVFGVMAAAPRHTFQVLTKRPERAREFFAWAKRYGDGYDLVRTIDSSELLACAWEACSGDAWGDDVEPPDLLDAIPGPEVFGRTWPLPNVWLGVSVEDQRTADERIPALRTLPAAVRWVSYEPAVGSVVWREEWMHGRFATPGSPNPTIDWIVVGGESGPGARPCALEWLSSTVAQCRAAGVPVFVKQLGACVDSILDDPEEQRALGLSSRWAWGAGLRDPKGGDPSEWPEDLRVREWPEVRHACADDLEAGRG